MENPNADPEKKVTLISDSIYNTIKISALEKEVISNDVFNRLHNILQNSTAYLTYPSLRTSRFSHSLGCMHLAGMIFQQGMINAKNKTRNLFYKAAEAIIEQAQTNTFASDCINRCKINEHLDHCEKVRGTSFSNEALYAYTTPTSNISDAQFTYIFIYQAIRIAALLHDLGHPPFSHIVENALSDIFKKLEIKIQENKTLNERENDFYSTIQSIRFGENKNKKIHEFIGVILSNYVLSEVVDSIAQYNQNWTQIYDTIIICQIALNILNEKSEGVELGNVNFYRSIHRIIDGELDADRLDYLERDLRNSSNRGHIHYDRLLAGFCLISENNCANDIRNCKFEFVPSIQSLSEIEEFYKKRFELYKVILYHHRVAKTDGLLSEAVFHIALEYLNKTPDSEIQDTIEKNDKEKLTNLLTPNIYWLWKILMPKERNYTWRVTNKYFQWDDAWLLNCLRKRYLELKDEQQSKKADITNSQDNNLFTILEELLTNKKRYVSLFKRPNDFQIIDDNFLFAALDDTEFDWDQLSKILSPHSSRGKYLLGNITSYIEISKSIKNEKYENIPYPFPNSINELRICRGFFINSILDYMMTSGSWTNDKKQQFFWKAIKKIIDIKEQHQINIDDIIPLFKSLKPGVSEEFHISVDGQLAFLGNYSPVVKELTLGSALFPPFFVAVYSKNNSLTTEKLIKIQELLGKALWDSYKEMLADL
jgi:HD superfamily phosphohydrolase